MDTKWSRAGPEAAICENGSLFDSRRDAGTRAFLERRPNTPQRRTCDTCCSDFIPGFVDRLLLLLALSPLLAVAQPDETVRVRLFAPTPPESVTITSSSPMEVRHGDSERLTVRAGEPVHLSVRGGRLQTRGLSGTMDRLSLVSDGPLQVRSGSRTRTYAGSLTAEANRGRLLLVNHVAMPSYVASVVASEYPFSEIEGIKAQAVLARTYAARRIDPARPYDVDDHEGSQVYKGLDVVTARSTQAAEETRGERLYYGSELAEAVYSSSSGGHTADNESLWNGAPVPYLRGVPDPYDADAPDHRWTTTIDARDVHTALSRQYGGQIRSVSVAERSFEGRATRIELAGSRTISASQFRATLNAALGYRTVRSTFLDIDRQGDRYVLSGRGFGHGVGMSQYGARGQAREGRSYREILAYYFQGTTVERDPTSDLPAVATHAPRWPTPRREARQAAEATETTPPAVRRSPTPRHEARAEQARRGW